MTARTTPRMTPERLRAFCLSFDDTVEDFPFNPETSVFKVAGKLFALSALGARPLTVNLKATRTTPSGCAPSTRTPSPPATT